MWGCTCCGAWLRVPAADVQCMPQPCAQQTLCRCCNLQPRGALYSPTHNTCSCQGVPSRESALTPPGTGSCPAPAAGCLGTAPCAPGSGSPRWAGCGPCSSKQRGVQGSWGTGCSRRAGAGRGAARQSAAFSQANTLPAPNWGRQQAATTASTPQVLIHCVGIPPRGGIHICLAVGVGDVQHDLGG